MPQEEIAELIDHYKLKKLVTAYCRAVDRRDVRLMRELYHPDAIDDHGQIFYGTAEAFYEFLPGALVQFSMTTHHIANSIFRIEGDYAEGETYLIAAHVTKEQPPRNLIVSGRYLDKFERRDGQWRFSHRVSLVDWANFDAEALGEMFPAQNERQTALGRVDLEDPSYLFLPLLRC